MRQYFCLFLQLAGLILGSLALASCASTYPNQNLTGKTFISVEGQSLDQKNYLIPQDFPQLTLFLIGYKQDSQFDIDRWLIALDMSQITIDAYELPTIQGLFPRMFETQINNGMRAGIPKPLWKGVITIYQDGAKVQQFTGNEYPNNARVVLMDRNGKILYFYDQGFSVDALNALKKHIENSRRL